MKGTNLESWEGKKVKSGSRYSGKNKNKNSSGKKPKTLMKLGKYSLVQWNNYGKKVLQLRKDTYNPKTKENIIQAINLNSMEDVILVKELVGKYYENGFDGLKE